jgi:hypothetical protein
VRIVLLAEAEAELDDVLLREGQEALLVISEAPDASREQAALLLDRPSQLAYRPRTPERRPLPELIAEALASMAPRGRFAVELACPSDDLEIEVKGIGHTSDSPGSTTWSGRYPRRNGRPPHDCGGLSSPRQGETRSKSSAFAKTSASAVALA